MSNYNFATVPKAEIQRSSFDRSHTWKGTFDAGKLIPFFVDEVLPGDTFNLNVSMLCRLATPIVPFMDNVYLDTFFFFVPDRLVWNNFQKFMGEREDPDDSIDFLIPQTFSANTEVEANSVLDYMGFPIGSMYGVGGSTNNKLNANVLPMRAYALTWNEWFRDENLQDSIKIQKGDSSGYTTDTTSLPNGLFNIAGSCLPRGKRHDYFTSALPWPQKGDSVDIPLGTKAPVVGISPLYFQDESGSIVNGQSLNLHSTTLKNPNGSSPSLAKNDGSWYVPAVFANQPVTTTSDQFLPLRYKSGLEVDLTNATAATINTLRQAFQVQRLLERDARGGTRYTEILRSHFNVVSPDARLQRPEYLGGSSTPFIVNPVAQTAATDAVTPQGNLAAFGVAAPNIHGFTKSFVEHGYIIGMACVRADLTYQQGLNKMWSRKTRYDFYWPTLAHLGEQAILNKEIYAQGTSDDDAVFGYQERYAEYRYYPSMITGEFRSTYTTPLDSWHLAQKFDSLPTLSEDFIVEDPPVDRVIAVPSEPQFLMDAYFKLNCVRPMPLYGTPGLIDHF